MRSQIQVLRRLTPVALVALASMTIQAETPLPSDAELTRTVELRLRQTPSLLDERFRVSVEQRQARLTGSATSLWAIWEAERAAGKVYGIEAVDSRIDLLFRTPDPAILGGLRRTFADLDTWDDLEFDVSEGRVTLRGAVSDARSRISARSTAAKVPGVTEVVDELTVPPLDDEAISGYLLRLYSGRLTRVSAPEGRIQPTVDDGIVTLTGTAPRPFARDEAERLAWGVNGVLDVRNEIRVVPVVP
jgi:osmotically-inducible protein OsmY